MNETIDTKEKNSSSNASWEKYYNYAKKYYEHHGNLMVNWKFKTTDGFTYDENGIYLGNWIATQRARFSKLPIDRQERLKSIGFVVSAREEQWNVYYKLAKSYYEYYGHLDVPAVFATNNGYIPDENGIRLGRWITEQKRTFSKLPEDKQSLLKQIGLTLDICKQQPWEENYKLAKAYYEHHANLLIPTTFITRDGYTYDVTGIKLGIWLRSQRETFDKLTSEQQALLTMIGFKPNARDEQWSNNYKLAKAYFIHNGNLLIPSLFITKDGYTYDKDGVKLGLWITYQRRNFSKLSKEKQELLNKIGFVESIHIQQTWEEKYELAKNYYEHHKNLLVPDSFKTSDGFTYDENGINLGNWIMKQRQNFSELTPERQNLLNNIGFVKDAREELWLKNYNLLKTYYENFGNLNVPANFKTNDGLTYDENGLNISNWLLHQRTNFANLSPKRQELLQNIGFAKSTVEEKWLLNYKLAKTYFEHHGNLIIPENFITKDGFTYDEEGVKLGKWLKNQQAYFGGYSKEKQEMLRNIGFINELWQIRYEQAKAYYEHHGNLFIPDNFKTNDGYTYDESGTNLGSWIAKQRRYFYELSPERQRLLKDIGFIRDISDERWYKKYELARAYYNRYGNLLIPRDFITKDGYTPSATGIKLGSWLTTQKTNFSDLSEEKQALLNNIGFVNGMWEMCYKLAKVYYEHFGDSLIPTRFKTNDGYTYKESGIKLGKWLNNQKAVFSRLSKERRDLLREIGVVATLEDRWLVNYKLAKSYYEHHGNIMVKPNFRTSDGFTYDKNGVNLGTWLKYQIKTCDPDSEHGKLLKEIGVSFYGRKRNQEIMDICASNNIDPKINKTTLTHISLEELTSKINFLKEHNLPLTLDDGKLSEIFSLSNKDMKEKYGISLEELVSKYSLKVTKAKGV